MTPFVVAAFKDRSGAESALERLRGSGLATNEARLHSTADVSNAATVEADEVVSGGFFGNVAKLLNGLLDSPAHGTQATDYDDLARRKATLISVGVESAQNAKAVADLLSAAGAERVSTLPQPGLES